MLERRPVWGLILGLNVCVVIWRISVQEPAMLEAESMASSGVGGGVSSVDAESAVNSLYTQQLSHASAYNSYNSAQARIARHGFVGVDVRQQLYAGKHLLAERSEVSENVAKATQSAAELVSGTSNESKFVKILKHKAAVRSAFSSSNGSNVSGSSENDKVSALSFNASAGNSTPTPLVTVATLRNIADLQGSITTTTVAADTRWPALPAGDFTQLINLHNFTYLMTQPSCSVQTEALVLVHSAPGNRQKRMVIRETWGAVDQLPKVAGITPFRVVFLLGAVAEERLQRKLEHENMQFGDMVQGSFIDDYRNMTYKHVMAFKWFLYNCAHAQILMKVDDDVYVNTPQLLIYWRNSRLYNKTASSVNPITITKNNMTTAKAVAAAADATDAVTNTADEFNEVDFSNDIAPNSTNSQSNVTQALFRHPQNLLFCERKVGAKVKRTYRSKWRVAPYEYDDRYYPPYCPGYAIIYSPDVVLRLYKAAQHTKYFWIDDVLITGVLAQKLNIRITHSQAYVLYDDMCQNLLQNKLKCSDVNFVYAWHLIKPQEMRALWEIYSAMAKEEFGTPTSFLPTALAVAAKNVTSEYAHKIDR